MQNTNVAKWNGTFLREFKSCVPWFYLRNHVPVLYIVVQHVLVVCLLAVDNLLCIYNIYNTMYMYGFMYLRNNALQ